MTELLRCLLQVDPHRRPSLEDILGIDIVKKYQRGHRGIYLARKSLSDELKLNGRTFPLKTSSSDSIHLMVERARMVLEKECGHLFKEYYDAVALHLQHSHALPFNISMELAQALAVLITSEVVSYHRPS